MREGGKSTVKSIPDIGKDAGLATEYAPIDEVEVSGRGVIFLPKGVEVMRYWV